MTDRTLHSRAAPGPRAPLTRLGAAIALAIGLAACGASTITPQPTPTILPIPGASQSAPTGSPETSAAPSQSQTPDTGAGTTTGDVPDNAIYLTYRQAALHFSIKYVEGWQLTTQPDGVVIRDKDSSETVAVVNYAGDPGAYVTSTDLPALQAQAGFQLVKRDIVKVGSTSLVHLVFHLPSPPDPVTGKQVPSTVDRYYVPGSGVLAIVSLATPDGVDNVDAFRIMIESFKWS